MTTSSKIMTFRDNLSRDDNILNLSRGDNILLSGCETFETLGRRYLSQEDDLLLLGCRHPGMNYLRISTSQMALPELRSCQLLS